MHYWYRCLNGFLQSKETDKLSHWYHKVPLGFKFKSHPLLSDYPISTLQFVTKEVISITITVIFWLIHPSESKISSITIDLKQVQKTMVRIINNINNVAKIQNQASNSMTLMAFNVASENSYLQAFSSL